jgi:glycine/D-amino acid oxidase-like deaminating enzyme
MRYPPQKHEEIMMLPKTADAVIIGGGVMGASTAYHLAKRGMKISFYWNVIDFLAQAQQENAREGYATSFQRR